ncbi:MAG: bestrophin family ion channel [Flavobacteriales bacterium]
MITRDHLELSTSLRYSWRNMVFSATCASAAFALVHSPIAPWLEVPITVVAILGTALAIILGFKNSSAYDRWWEARKIWGGVVNDSRTLTRQVLSMALTATVPASSREALRGMVRTHLAWINALRLQLRRIGDEERWKNEVSVHLAPEQYAALRAKTNKVTHLGLQQGAVLKGLHDDGAIDSILYAQMDNTLARLTDLQGMAERIRSTPLPRPYDYYTKAFLNVFILFFPFGVVRTFEDYNHAWLVIPVTVIIGWIFYQLYIFGKVMSNPFENWQTDVALDAICTTIAIDLKEALGDTDVPKPLEPVDGVLM